VNSDSLLVSFKVGFVVYWFLLIFVLAIPGSKLASDSGSIGRRFSKKVLLPFLTCFSGLVAIKSQNTGPCKRQGG
jgi:hypothetical protein